MLRAQEEPPAWVSLPTAHLQLLTTETRSHSHPRKPDSRDRQLRLTTGNFYFASGERNAALNQPYLFQARVVGDAGAVQPGYVCELRRAQRPDDHAARQLHQRHGGEA